MGNLLDLRSEIADRFGIKSEIVAADQRLESGRGEITAKLEELKAIGALLGAGLTKPGVFNEDNFIDYADLINTNILGFTDLIARIIKVFEKRDSQSAILAISSLGAETSLPYQAVYGASKAYVNALIQAIAVELIGSTVSVGSFLPGGIDTPMAAQSRLRWGKTGLMNVDRCAALAVKALIQRKQFSVPGLGNWFTYVAARAMPRSLIGQVTAMAYHRPSDDPDDFQLNDRA